MRRGLVGLMVGYEVRGWVAGGFAGFRLFDGEYVDGKQLAIKSCLLAEPEGQTMGAKEESKDDLLKLLKYILST